MGGRDDSLIVDNICRHSSSNVPMGQHSSCVIVRNIAEFVADAPSSSSIVDAPDSPVPLKT